MERKEINLAVSSSFPYSLDMFVCCLPVYSIFTSKFTFCGIDTWFFVKRNVQWHLQFLSQLITMISFLMKVALCLKVWLGPQFFCNDLVKFIAIFHFLKSV